MYMSIIRYLGGAILAFIIVLLVVGAFGAARAGHGWWILAVLLAVVAWRAGILGYKYVIKGGA